MVASVEPGHHPFFTRNLLLLASPLDASTTDLFYYTPSAHDSNITSPWTAFSFHPLEALLQALFLPALLVIMPMHISVLLIHLSLMTITSVVNHLDIEIYSKKFHRNVVGRWLIGATHHALHHKHFRYNFGFYFTFWDKWKKTESPEYEEWFEQHSNRAGQKTSH